LTKYPGIQKKKRAEMPELPVYDRIKTFEEADLVLQEEDAIREAQRCLACCRICYNKDVAA
jgi:formate dehydrogenase (NADP+) beta subunit